MNLLRRVYDAFNAGGPLLADDRPRWAAARTLTDLCDLTALWLEGRIDSQPHYYGRVDVDEGEASGLTQALVALNRAGFLTYQSQAGYDGPGYDGANWMQLAAVIGYADLATVEILRAALPDWYQFVVHTGLRRRFQRSRPGAWVTYRDGSPYTGFAWQTTRRQIAFEWDGCHRDAIRAIESACTIAIYDPTPGPNDLWSDVVDALTSGAQR